MNKIKSIFGKANWKEIIILSVYGLLFVAVGIFASQVFLQKAPVQMSDSQFEQLAEIFEDDNIVYDSVEVL